MVLLERRKQTPEKAASLGTHLPVLNLGQLHEGREGRKKEGRIGSSVPQESEMIQAYGEQMMRG